MNDDFFLIKAKEILHTFADNLLTLEKKLGQSFSKTIELIYLCKQKVVVTGMGKSGHIGRKIASTLASTGTPAIFIHPAESGHGDIGMSMPGDIFIIISKSGESQELNFVLDFAKRHDNAIIAICNNKESTLGRNATIFLPLHMDREACPMNLAPTTSPLLTLALGDALAVTLMMKRGFNEEKYRFFHPGGNIGKKLRKINDIMHTKDQIAIIKEDTPLLEILEQITKHQIGEAVFVDDQGKLTGIVTDGDLRRFLIKHKTIEGFSGKDIMTRKTISIPEDSFIGEALKIMEGKTFALVVVNEENKPVGLIRIHDILQKGLL